MEWYELCIDNFGRQKNDHDDIFLYHTYLSISRRYITDVVRRCRPGPASPLVYSDRPAQLS